MLRKNLDLQEGISSPLVKKIIKKWGLSRIAYGGCVVTHAGAELMTAELPERTLYQVEFTYFDIDTMKFSTLESGWIAHKSALRLYEQYVVGRRVWNSVRLFARTPDGREFWLLKL